MLYEGVVAVELGVRERVSLAQDTAGPGDTARPLKKEKKNRWMASL